MNQKKKQGEQLSIFEYIEDNSVHQEYDDGKDTEVDNSQEGQVKRSAESD